MLVWKCGTGINRLTDHGKLEIVEQMKLSNRNKQVQPSIQDHFGRLVLGINFGHDGNKTQKRQSADIGWKHGWRDQEPVDGGRRRKKNSGSHHQ